MLDDDDAADVVPGLPGDELLFVRIAFTYLIDIEKYCNKLELIVSRGERATVAVVCRGVSKQSEVLAKDRGTRRLATDGFQSTW